MTDVELFKLVVRFKKGGKKAFDILFEETKGKIFLNIYSYVKNKEASEDILLDTYISFIKSIDKIEKNKSVLGYLYTISRNLSLNYIEKNKNIAFLDSEELPVVGQNDPRSVDNSFIIQKMKEILSDDALQIVLLKLVNELDYKEISQNLNKNESTVRWIYNESIKKLKEFFKDEWFRKED